MNAGKYNHRITIIQDVNRNMVDPPTDENGAPLEDWQPFKNLWSKKEGLNPRLFYQSAGEQSEVNVMFLIRYVTGITADMKVSDNEGTYQIRGIPVDKDGTRKELIIYAREVINSGR